MLLFQPPVMCTKSAAYNRSRKHLEVLEMPEIVELGSLYLDGQCVVVWTRREQMQPAAARWQDSRVFNPFICRFLEFCLFGDINF